MPLHDWTRVSANDYHHFHFAWIAALSHVLNARCLPSGYFALAVHTAPPYVPDVLTLSLPNGTDAGSPQHRTPNDGNVATLTLPVAKVESTEAGKKRKPVGRRRVAIRHVENRQLVAVIEVVSPSNKSSKAEFADLRDKSVELLRAGIHLLLIDPFPAGSRDPNGIHDAVWRALTGKRFTLPAPELRTFVGYAARGENMFSASVEPVAVGETLPELPVFLTPQSHIVVPLEETYLSAWDAFPAILRPLLG